MAYKKVGKIFGPFMVDEATGALLVMTSEAGGACECEHQADVALEDGDYHEATLGTGALAIQFKSTGAGVYIYTGAASLTDAAIDTLLSNNDGMDYAPNLNFPKTHGIEGKPSIYFKRSSASAANVKWDVIRTP